MRIERALSDNSGMKFFVLGAPPPHPTSYILSAMPLSTAKIQIRTRILKKVKTLPSLLRIHITATSHHQTHISMLVAKGTLYTKVPFATNIGARAQPPSPPPKAFNFVGDDSEYNNLLSTSHPIHLHAAVAYSTRMQCLAGT